MYRVDGRKISNLFLLYTSLKPALSLLSSKCMLIPSSLSRNINIVYRSTALMMGDNNISTKYTKVPSDRLVYTQPSKSSYPKRSSNWRNGLYDILDLVEESNQQGEDNPVVLFQNEKYVCIYDMYPKAKYHMLLMRRKNIEHIGQMNNIYTLNDLQPSNLHEMKEFHTLARNIATNLESSDQSIKIKLGYHALPSFEPLHLHLISSDLNSKCITKKKHVISFTSPLFFIDPTSVESHLESAFADSCLLSVRKERATSVLDDTPMVCTRCKRQAVSVPDWKRHNEVCDVIPMEKETDQKLNSLIGWKRQPLSDEEKRGTKRSKSTTVSTFDGVQTKYGKRLRKEEDKETHNARVRNTYLKIDMDESIFDRLHNMVNRVGREWTEENNTRHHQSKSKKQAKKQLTISPRSRHSVHMTYFFMGRVLNDMPSEDVQRWNTMVRSCVLVHNKIPRDYTLSFKSLILFPPNRNYLVVAEFEASSDLVGLYNQLCSLALAEKSGDNTHEYEFPLLRELTLKQQQYDSKWIPHVTLGNVQGGSREDVTRLGEWLGNKTYEDISSTNVLGLSLGGPMPQVDINWKFPFINSR